ncbi:hypothetical protein MKEN_01095200 [Mycena kentingensis (nom. inval.)]|nr:hypothetical protein MKEN_01095200 [Mycena kentingensis (nom. inval.)]
MLELPPSNFPNPPAYFFSSAGASQIPSVFQPTATVPNTPDSFENLHERMPTRSPPVSRWQNCKDAKKKCDGNDPCLKCVLESVECVPAQRKVRSKKQDSCAACASRDLACDAGNPCGECIANRRECSYGVKELAQRKPTACVACRERKSKCLGGFPAKNAAYTVAVVAEPLVVVDVVLKQNLPMPPTVVDRRHLTAQSTRLRLRLS